MATNHLLLARDNAEFNLHQAHSMTAETPDEEAERFFAISYQNRLLGICHLLIDADQTGFVSCLAKSGQARLVFLRLVKKSDSFPAKFSCASKNLGFSDALVAGDLVTARAIADISPRQHVSDYEYEDDFLFYHFMQRFLIDPKHHADLKAVIARWNEVLEGKDSAYLDACRGLLDDSDKTFNTAFLALVTERKEQLARYRASAECDRTRFATEGMIDIECLAVLRLAGLQGFFSPKNHPLAPSIARIPQGFPLPDPDAWMKP